VAEPPKASGRWPHRYTVGGESARITPTKENIMSGKYPLFRPLYLITKGKPQSEAKAFIDWLLSDEDLKLISGQGTVNLNEGRNLAKVFKHWEHKNLIWNFAE